MGNNPCTVCIHDDLDAIDRALVTGRQSTRQIAKDWGISPSSMARHRKDHVSGALVPVVVEGSPIATLDRIEGLIFEAQRVLRNAQAEEHSKDALAAIGQLTKLVELIAKVRGEMTSGPTVQVVNVSTSAEWVGLRSALIRALTPFPEAALAVSDAIEAHEAGR